MNEKKLQFICLLLLLSGNLHGIIANLNDSTDNWIAIQYLNQSDYYNDVPAQSGGDIIGDPNNNQSGFYKRYEYGADGLVDTDDDLIAFRIRSSNDFLSYYLIGCDVDNGVDLVPDGAIDFYLGVSFVGGNNSKTKIAFYDTGTGANTSPSTASFNERFVYKNSAIASDNFDDYANKSAVVLAENEGYDGPDATDDLNADGVSDYFVSFQVEMSVLNQQYQAISGTLNELKADSQMRLVLGSSDNDLNFNQDWAGMYDNINEDAVWDESLGTQIYTLQGATPVPEPSSYALIFAALAGVAGCLKRWR